MNGIGLDFEKPILELERKIEELKKFTSSGTFITKWGLKGTGDGQFNYAPNTIAVDTSGNVYVGEGSRI